MSGAMHRPTASATMAERADLPTVSHPLYIVQQPFMHDSAADTKLAAHATSMAGELMRIARALQHHRDTS